MKIDERCVTRECNSRYLHQ